MPLKRETDEGGEVRDPFRLDQALSPHDAMSAWAAGQLRTAKAVRMVGADDLFGLIAACASSGVSLDREMTETERAQVAVLTEVAEPLT
jgi:hypothetical protein